MWGFLVLIGWLFIIVPIYDAWEVIFDVKSDLENLQSILPIYEGEIPIGSCVAIGHSISSYISKKDSQQTDVNLVTNILFVIILGIWYLKQHFQFFVVCIYISTV